MNILQICPPNLSNVNTLPREIQKSFSTVLFIHSSVYMLRKNTALPDESGGETKSTVERICV